MPSSQAADGSTAPLLSEQSAPQQPSSAIHHSETTRLLLISHGEAMQARYADFRGDNSGLTARGWRQAEGLAEWLRAHEVAGVACTLQLPARLTAQHVAQRLGLSAAVQPQLATQNGSDSPQFSDALTELLDQQRGQSLALVSDAATIAAILCQLFDAPRLRLELSAASIVELVQRGAEWALVAVDQRREQQPTAGAAATAPSAQTEVFRDEHLALIAATYNRVAEGVTTEGERERRQRVKHLLDFAELPAGGRVIDIGTGSGLLATAVGEQTGAEVVGVDVSAGMLEQAEFLRLSDGKASAQRVSFQLAPAQALPFPDGYFAAALLRLVLHHSERPALIIREAARVLKPGGVLVVADLLSDEDPVKRATQNTIEARRNSSHVAAHSASQYRQLLVDNGFTPLAEREVHFERELDGWLDDLEVDAASRETVRDMVMAGIETDAAGLGARLVKKKLVFDQRLFYVKAVKGEQGVSSR